ncbi:MAG: hypothetical protein LBH69_05605 [Methanomassiliicoccaceae archaeon]|jgi:hypothetical protein|nr:hypothetical protein [Methanomassiliicoccaceae archaeon]
MKALETDPYGLLLHSLGSERERGSGEWEANSDNVYAFDAECVEGDDTYQKAFTRLSVLSNGSFSEITGSVDRKKGRASVSFSFNGRRYDWELEYDHDWFDIRSMDRVNELLRRSGSAKLFHASSSGQEVVIVFADPKTVERLNGLVAVPFLPEIF